MKLAEAGEDMDGSSDPRCYMCDNVSDDCHGGHGGSYSDSSNAYDGCDELWAGVNSDYRGVACMESKQREQEEGKRKWARER